MHVERSWEQEAEDSFQTTTNKTLKPSVLPQQGTDLLREEDSSPVQDSDETTALADTSIAALRDSKQKTQITREISDPQKLSECALFSAPRSVVFCHTTMENEL